ncbi:MAG: radical SAM protein [Deltaproteobacteria bacterium]|nr:radical SAM protein [Deltaproteobacteria bacterium]
MSTPKPIDPDTVFALVANRKGEIFDHPEWLMLGASGRRQRRPTEAELIPLPPGSRLFFLPDCPPLGWDKKTRQERPISRLKGVGNDGLQGVAAFLPPAYSRFLLPAVSYQNKAYTLPLWAYTAVGWSNDIGYVTTACRVDANRQWEPEYFDDREVVAGVDKKLARYPNNRLIDHMSRCAVDYHCFAAKNFFLERWECPLPVSPTCNANCIGCLSHQEEVEIKKGESCPASHERISFVPSLKELLEVALPHIEVAENPVLSFGQGCEGDPILQAERICEFARAVRQTTAAGTLNVNTNASLPQKVAAMAKAGMDSIRVSLNSARKETYLPYYRPRGYAFADVLESLKEAKAGGLQLAINLLVLPGVTDAEAEVAALLELIEKYHIDQVQMRNLCIDPRQYCDLFADDFADPIGIVNLLERLRRNFPDLHIGYFNRYLGPKNATDHHQ